MSLKKIILKKLDLKTFYAGIECPLLDDENKILTNVLANERFMY